jgi:hypothetical protein
MSQNVSSEVEVDSYAAVTRNYLGLLCFWTFSIVPYSKEHNVSETGSISFFR